MWTSPIPVETDRSLGGLYRVTDVFLSEGGRRGGDAAIEGVQPGKAPAPDVRRPFAGERRSAAWLSYNAVGVYDIGEDRTSPYWVTAL